MLHKNITGHHYITLATLFTIGIQLTVSNLYLATY